jgi:hypothetical protein
LIVADNKPDTKRKGGVPPKEHRFRKGVSGNPAGRPKGSKNLMTVVMEAAVKGDQPSLRQALDLIDEMERRAAEGAPSRFELGPEDVEVLNTVYARMKQYTGEQ